MGAPEDGEARCGRTPARHRRRKPQGGLVSGPAKGLVNTGSGGVDSRNSEWRHTVCAELIMSLSPADSKTICLHRLQLYTCNIKSVRR
jgi:hypothetical protein